MLGGVAAPLSITHAGRTYTARMFDQGLKTEIERNIMVEKIRELMKSLPSEQQKSVELAFFEGLSHAEVAAKGNQVSARQFPGFRQRRARVEIPELSRQAKRQPLRLRGVNPGFCRNQMQHKTNPKRDAKEFVRPQSR